MKVGVEAGGGASFSGILCVAFVVLKLTGVIDWSWWWVTSPIWGSLLLALSALGVLLVIDPRVRRHLFK